MLPVDILRAQLEQGDFDRELSLIHSGSRLKKSGNRLERLLKRMAETFSPQKAGIASAPGRTEMGGNHTDHNHGRVLAAAINLDCLAVFSEANSSDKDTVTILSENYERPIIVNLSDTSPREEEKETSEAIVRGVADGFRRSGFKISGFNACVSSTIPAGTGLSSSAAFEVLVGRIFNHLFNNSSIGPLDIARIAKRAENIHFGKPCGFMDQMACSFEGILSIDFKNPDNPGIKRVTPGFGQHDCTNDFYGTGYRLCVLNTGGSHADLTPDYAAIPSEMTAAANSLGHTEARGITTAEVLDNIDIIRKQAGDRALLRLFHFIGEDERAVLQAEALLSGDMTGFLRLVEESGNSSSHLLQNCYSTTDPSAQPIPLALHLTGLLLDSKGVARIHGGGFAGTIQAYVHESCFDKYRRTMEKIFGTGSLIELMIRQPGHEFLTAGPKAGR
ncbi:galactokinase family protein [Maridesulfovibrio sp.]|uniref:galactokinase n=1 Tax=Maridesulfovibrio sp. TaxID=2795000 RepID=UPI002A18C456|nr:galactokinase family protein [Maridesulfovibrio sp.]